jgi:hypothetical protein
MPEESNDNISRFGTKITALKDSPMALVFIVSFLTGGGVTTGLNGLTDSRPDPYTGTMGAAEQLARKSADAIERREREAEDIRLSARIQGIAAQIASCQTYQHKHEVEAARGFARIEQLEKKWDRYHRYEKDNR